MLHDKNFFFQKTNLFSTKAPKCLKETPEPDARYTKYSPYRGSRLCGVFEAFLRNGIVVGKNVSKYDTG